MSLTSAPRSQRASWLGLALILLVVGGGSQLISHLQQQRAADTIRQLARPGSITLYTTSTCTYCAKAEAWLNAHGIPWQACSIETDATCLATFNAAGAPGTPLVRANEQWHLGFDPDWLAEALKVAPTHDAHGTPSDAQPKPNAATSPRP